VDQVSPDREICRIKERGLRSSGRQIKEHSLSNRLTTLLSIFCFIAICTNCDWSVWQTSAEPVNVPTPNDGDSQTVDDSAEIRVHFNPEQKLLPFPSDLYRSADRVNVTSSAARSEAEKDYFSRIFGQDGFPRQSSMHFLLTGDLDEESLSGGFSVFVMDTQEEIQFAVELVHAGVRLVPNRALPKESTIIFAALNSLRGTNGQAVIADEALSRAKSGEELEDASDEAMRQTYAPYFQALENRAISRSEIVGLAAFTTTSELHIRLDARAGEYPTPHFAWMDQETGQISVPDDLFGGEFAVGFSEYDGFGTSSALIIQGHEALDPNTWLEEDTVRLYRIDDGSFAEVTDVTRTLVEPNVFALRPRLPLHHSALYAVTVSRQATASGLPFGPELHSIAGMLQNDLQQGVESAIRSLANSEAAQIEQERVLLNPLLQYLEENGIDRSSLAAAFPFPTTTAPQWGEKKRDQLYEESVPTAVTNVVVATPAERGLWLVMPNVETVVSGTMPILDHIDPLTGAQSESGPVVSDIEFVVTLPENVADGTDIPVVLFGHGLTTSRELVYLVADMLAQRGYAAISIDFPYHGARSVCLGDFTCAGDARCGMNGQCVHDNGSPGEIVTINSFWDDGFSVPTTSGLAFIDLDNIFASRDHFIQALVDLCQLVRVIEDNDWNSITGGFSLAKEDLLYLGISLGGVLGAGFAAIEPKVDNFAFNVGGVSLIDMMMDSTILGPILNSSLEENGIERNTPEFFYYEMANRWALDPTDPANYIRDAALEKRFLVQMSQGDDVVPNMSTKLLAELADVTLHTYTPLISNHAFLFDPTSIEGAEAKAQILDFFDAR
jgi:pimeloyl-ACP methyl ester carboxylesterase